MANVFDKIMKVYSDEDETVEQEAVAEESEAVSEYEEPVNDSVKALNKAEMVIVEPRSTTEVTTIVDYLKRNKMVVVNYHKLQSSEAQRLLDYLSGAVYALDGSSQAIGPNVVLFAPKNRYIAGGLEAEDAQQ